MTSEFEKFQADLLDSVEQMRNGEVARTAQAEQSPVAAVRAHVGVSQREFAAILGVSPRTLQECEQGRREPTGAARTLLLIAVRHPEVLRDLPSSLK